MPTNIIGESFKPYVKTQIETRQKKLSLVSNRDPDLLKYINNKTSWIRLSSGVDVAADKATELGMSSLSGNELAKQSVLFSARKSGEFTYGVGYNLDNPSYGYAPGIGHGNMNSDYGLVPPAGITSANIRPLSQGSLREATVQITCHNLPQFKTIEALYLRLGYSMLLEWGHTLWYDNKNTLHYLDSSDWIYEGFIKGDYNQDGILEDLEKQRESTCGNYDAFFGRVVNFSWSFRPDGGYDITVNLRAIGDVIESLKINVNLPSSTSQPSSTSASEPSQPPVVANKDKSTLHKILFSISKELELYQDNGRYLDGFNVNGRPSLQTSEIIRITKDHAKFDLGKANYKDPNEIWDKANNILTYQEGYMAIFNKITSDPDEGDSGGNFYYIKLGTLLRIVESFLLKYDTTKEKNGSYSPIFYIDHDFDTNICLTIPRQIGLNPHICLLPPGSLTQTSTANATSLPKQYIKITYKKIVPDFSLSQLILNSDPIRFEKLPEETITENNPIDPSLIVTEIRENGNDGIITSLDVIYGPNGDKYFESGGGKRIEADPITGDLFPENGELFVFYQAIDELSSDTIEYSFDDGGQVNQGNLSRILSSYRINNYPFLGKFMHLLINLDYIASVLSNNIDEEGKLSVLAFLQDIANGISEATGKINNFNVTYDETTNIFSFRDNNIPPDGHKYLKQIKPELDIDIIPTKFNINLLKSDNGSFVKDVSIKSELDNNFATQITVGAQTNGNKVGENSTALSKLNVGFKDRIISEKSSWVDDISKDSPSGSKSPSEIYAEQLLSYVVLKKNINEGNVTEEDISNNTQAIVDMYQYHLGYATQKGEIAGVGFIPINLQLTVDGLSGPRLFETYTINDEILPTNYQNNIKFIIRGINHTIDVTNGWTTTLESFSVPRRDNLTKHTMLTDPEFSTSSPNQPGTIVSFASFQSANGTNANQLRAVMASLGYAEKQKQLDDSGSDITQEIAEVGAQVLKTIKANYPSLLITVNAGRDNWHKVNSATSPHNAGIAIDFKINLVRGDLVKNGAVVGSYTSTEIKILNDIEGILKGIQKTNSKLTYIDEYRNPSDRATGGHFHIAVK
jgi:hypothetical protein